MDISTIGTVVGIIAICYVIGLGCKAYEKIPDKWFRSSWLYVAEFWVLPDSIQCRTSQPVRCDQ